MGLKKRNSLYASIYGVLIVDYDGILIVVTWTHNMNETTCGRNNVHYI